MNTNKPDKNYREITERYYSLFLGNNENLFSPCMNEPVFFYTPIRNTQIQGYAQRFDLFAFSTGKTIIVSYGDIAKGKIPELKQHLETGHSLNETIHLTFGKEPRRSYKYYFSGKTPESTAALPLTIEDYPAFETFFLTVNNMDTKDIEWLREYFNEMIAEELCCGVFIDNRLVSCTDLPAVPFMSETVKEIGINTLENYRNLGYAKAACSCTIQQILKQGKCPIWSTGIENTASQRLAEALGFELLGESFALELK